MKALLTLLVALAAGGCASLSEEGRSRRLHAGLQEREVLALDSVLHWYQHYRNPKFTYRFDESEGSFSELVKDRLAAEIPEFRRKEEGAFFYVRMPKVEFPVAEFGYTEVVIDDPFYAERYVEVFEKKGQEWQIIDSITIASGALEALTTEFNWRLYYHDLLEKRSNQVPEPTAASGRGSS